MYLFIFFLCVKLCNSFFFHTNLLMFSCCLFFQGGGQEQKSPPDINECCILYSFSFHSFFSSQLQCQLIKLIVKTIKIN